MKILRKSLESEIILEFLSAEFESERFRAKIKDTLEKLHVDEQIITSANTNDEQENAARKQVLADFRGYGQNEGLFEKFPTITEWVYAIFDESDIDKIRYINYSYWNELSKHTGLPKVAAQTINEGIEIYNVSNDNFLKGKEYLIQGNSFRPIILITSDNEKYIVVEGHSRLTVYGLIPEKFDKTHCYIGVCSESELKSWNGL